MIQVRLFEIINYACRYTYFGLKYIFSSRIKYFDFEEQMANKWIKDSTLYSDFRNRILCLERERERERERV